MDSRVTSVKENAENRMAATKLVNFFNVPRIRNEKKP